MKAGILKQWFVSVGARTEIPCLQLADSESSSSDARRSNSEAQTQIRFRLELPFIRGTGGKGRSPPYLDWTAVADCTVIGAIPPQISHGSGLASLGFFAGIIDGDGMGIESWVCQGVMERTSNTSRRRCWNEAVIPAWG
jgi:hypothetical protein